MQIAMIGLGRMGANMARRLMADGHECVVYDRDSEQMNHLVAQGAVGAGDLAELARLLAPPRTAWVMVPAGEVTEQVVSAVAEHFEPGDTIIDGGNSYYKDGVRRAAELAKLGVHYLDVGTSGGVWGLERGYCLMIGGNEAETQRLEPVFRTLAPGNAGIPPSPGRNGGSAEQGYLYCGTSGAGHFAKMVHNGIEYGLMQAYAEGFDILRNANSESLPIDHRYDMKLDDIAELWRRGSVISSWLLDLSATALYARFRSRQQNTFAEKILSAMRHGFGGHAEPGQG